MPYHLFPLTFFVHDILTFLHCIHFCFCFLLRFSGKIYFIGQTSLIFSISYFPLTNTASVLTSFRTHFVLVYSSSSLSFTSLFVRKCFHFYCCYSNRFMESHIPVRQCLNKSSIKSNVMQTCNCCLFSFIFSFR